MTQGRKPNRYESLIEWVFVRNYEQGASVVPFSRTDLELGSDELGIALPKNLGDVIYAYRYRVELPESIQQRAPEGWHWTIRGTGKAKYRFEAVSASARVTPSKDLTPISIPDATPAIIRQSALGDEQALLALVRYNRLVDVFLGVTAYSLQNHLRTTAAGIGQVEIDEIYVAVDSEGIQYVVPVQAKGGNDVIGKTQAEQDLAVCRDKFPDHVARPVAAQFMADGVVAMFELTLREDTLEVARERHYVLDHGHTREPG